MIPDPRAIVNPFGPLARIPILVMLAAILPGIAAPPAGAQVHSAGSLSQRSAPVPPLEDGSPSVSRDLLPLDLAPIRYTALGALTGAVVVGVIWFAAGEGQPYWPEARGPILIGAGVGLVFDVVRWLESS